ncbi:MULTISPECIES: LuxR family transcriptional regulator [unclassified Serratia (in: enterobacteria)]|uniref:LuxR family transcriptional regulator n=1 Tax=unclassified Serratia (in: enterobacteria) TaxID=2647522 RepID=UPI001CBB112D|nr:MULTISPECIES: LuxR family transcriptional regulator [unclassified Serratia (in: enterobacteria)]UAN58230.1 LuxR family transcriptional regulator [Serratia sp. JSRIV004]UAN63619.1 LuxR family transcriptional regulator [Serratia sp. JSRIV006]
MSTFFCASQDEKNAFKNHLDKQIAEFGDFKYAHLILNKKDFMETLITSSYPSQWIDIYKERNYQCIDPVVLSALQRVSPFPWDESTPINPRLKPSDIFSHAKNYNITTGYTFVLHDHDHNLAMLTLTLNDSKSIDIEGQIHPNKARLQMLLANVHERFATRLQETARNNRDNSSEEKAPLTTRENEVLYWASMGKTYQEIAIILDVKVRTVKFHIGNIVKKMGVTNAKHAIRLGAEWQLVKPITR